MDYRKYGDAYYIRMDRGDEIINGILEICEKEKIPSCTFSGIGGCGHAELQTYIPDRGVFETEIIDGMLELINITGNIISDNGRRSHHTHALISYNDGKEHKLAAGHMKLITVLYTAEIELRPVTGGVIKREYDQETGTGFWCFD